MAIIIVMQTKLGETIVLSLILWKQINGLGKLQLMNVMHQVAKDSTQTATEQVTVGKTISINWLILIMDQDLISKLTLTLLSM